jgi:hypothetical protein
VINVRIPMKIGSDQVELSLRISEGDARKIVDAPRRTVRLLDQGMFQTVRDGLRTFLETEGAAGGPGA